MKQLISLCLLLVFISGAAAQTKKEKTVTIFGIVKGDTKGYNKIYFYSRNRSKDSVTIKEGKFTVVLPFEEPHMELFYTEYDVKQKGMYVPYSLLVDRPGVIYLKDIDVAKGLKEARVEGLKSARTYHAYTVLQKAINQKIAASLTGLYGKAWAPSKDPLYAPMEQSRDSLIRIHLVPAVQDFIKEHRDSYASVYVLDGAGRTHLNLSEMKASFGALSSRMKKSVEGKNFEDFIHGVEHSAVGSRVENFTLPNEQGADFTFSTLKGKYVLIDFWASWCVPCRKSFPDMRQLYQKYKSDRFEIYSISIDKDKDAWLKAVAEEKNPWLQTLDTKNLSQKGFAITGVPTMYLIDPEGRIVMKQIGFEPNGALEQKLAALLGKR